MSFHALAIVTCIAALLVARRIGVVYLGVALLMQPRRWS